MTTVLRRKYEISVCGKNDNGSEIAFIRLKIRSGTRNKK
ncbi:hypothetical protein SAMD00020551_0068 [Mesobacillus selenatarsenatis SF-1]|uniref:Uncharacterized protein n=1 Tax=Mesobacillus selenatarsenatis (strain DSM 18680 / JCM 14380 / FERM P-15431 / SF-1) TaxID=1321606 RepID=A0A0A8WWF0_MESS1|nr:hypothetical protein SAMD00020551_0068 [Mesobacillus selenatarsenatis SF-1]